MQYKKHHVVNWKKKLKAVKIGQLRDQCSLKGGRTSLRDHASDPGAKMVHLSDAMAQLSRMMRAIRLPVSTL